MWANNQSSKKSESYDNRSMATDDAIAAGGNKGSISRNQFAPKILNSGTGANLWPLAIAAALILVAVKIRFKLPKPKRK